MKKVINAIVWIVVIGAILFGIYMILPNYPQNFVKGHIQQLTNSSAQARIEQVQSLNNKDVNASYGSFLGKSTSMNAWVYYSAEDSGTGYEQVRFYGNGANINLKEIQGYDDMLYTSAAVEIIFEIDASGNVNITPYLDGVAIQGDNRETNEALKRTIFTQLYTGSGK